MDKAEKLRADAVRYRVIARRLTDPKASEAIARLADELDRRARDIVSRHRSG